MADYRLPLAPAPSRRPVARWTVLILLLPAELLGLTVRFDAASLADTQVGYAAALSQARALPQILLAAAAALVVIIGPRLKDVAGRMLKESAEYRGWRLFFALQLAAFGGLFAATAYIFEGQVLKSSAAPGLWFAAWSFLAAITLALWLAAAAPARCWARLVREEAAPLAIAAGVGVLSWEAGRWAQVLWRPLGEGTFYLVERMLLLIYPQSGIVSRPAELVLGARGFHVEIAPACSGYEGLGLVGAFLGTFLWIFRKSLRFPQAFVLIPVGLIGIWLANSVRIAALVVLGAEWSPAVAVGGFHSQAGWLAFNAIALGLVAAATRLPFFSRIDGRAAAESTNHTPAYLVPFLAIIATSMVTAAFQPDGFDRHYPLKVVAATIALWCFRGTYRQLDWTWSWTAVGAGAVVFFIWIGLDFFDKAEHSRALAVELSKLPAGWTVIWLAFRVVGAVITVPIAEELAFRGYLMRYSDKVRFEDQAYEHCSWLSVMISSVLFGLMHGRWLAGSLAGLVYALVVRRRGKLCDAIVAHGVTNLLVSETVLIGGFWWLW